MTHSLLVQGISGRLSVAVDENGVLAVDEDTQGDHVRLRLLRSHIGIAEEGIHEDSAVGEDIEDFAGSAHEIKLLPVEADEMRIAASTGTLTLTLEA